jgi:GNAT superfamily N-acetyltransferase
MPEINIRPANAEDIPTLTGLDHSYASDHVWQMTLEHDREAGQVNIQFRQVRLPRSVRVDYPYPPEALLESWERRSGLLIATLDEQPLGYACLALHLAPATAWITDLVVDRGMRRQGVGSSLVLAAAEWATDMECNSLILEMQPKNYAMIQMALKLGFEFCGFNDRYYPGDEIGLFFHKQWA